MNRRRAIAALGSACMCPLASRAQVPPKIPRVGHISSTNPTVGGPLLEAFRQRLRELGYVEGKTVALELRWVDGRLDQAAVLAKELIEIPVDVLVASSAVAARAARNITATVPIVAIAPDPVGVGLVASLARPGGNVTGLSYVTTELGAKRLEVLKDCMPGLVRAAILRNPTLDYHAVLWREFEAAAQATGIALQAAEAREPGDFEAAVATMVRGGAQAFIALDDPVTVTHRSALLSLAAANRLPAMYSYREFPEDGGLMSYGSNTQMLSRRAADYVDKILKGAKPADLPIEQASKFELVINLKTARSLGLEIPPSVLARADEVIE